MVIQICKGLALEYIAKTGWVCNHFSDESRSGCFKNKDDAFHGELLGISAGEHRLIHELAHHNVAWAMGEKYCPIVWNDAHQQPMPENAQELEWMITAVTYLAMQKPMRNKHEWSAIKKLATYKDPVEVASNLRYLFDRLTKLYSGKIQLPYPYHS